MCIAKSPCVVILQQFIWLRQLLAEHSSKSSRDYHNKRITTSKPEITPAVGNSLFTSPEHQNIPNTGNITALQQRNMQHHLLLLLLLLLLLFKN